MLQITTRPAQGYYNGKYWYMFCAAFLKHKSVVMPMDDGGIKQPGCPHTSVCLSVSLWASEPVFHLHSSGMSAGILIEIAKLIITHQQVHVTLTTLRSRVQRSRSASESQRNLVNAIAPVLLNHWRDLDQNLHNLFLQSDHEVIRFWRSWV